MVGVFLVLVSWILRGVVWVGYVGFSDGCGIWLLAMLSFYEEYWWWG